MKQVNNTRYRNFVVTQNNYPDTVLLDTVECRYIGYSKEVAPSTGTPHLQAFVCFYSAKTTKSVMKLLPGCHIEPMRGTISQNEMYCSKSSSLIERGEKPQTNENIGKAEQQRWIYLKNLAKEGKLEQLLDEHPKESIKYYNTFKNIARDHMQLPPNEECVAVWIYGNTGTGKSHAVHTQYPCLYKKQPNKWWDGYRNEETVYIEDLGKKHEPLGDYLKTWADKWSFPAEIKGGSICLRPKRIVVTSNYAIRQIWLDPDVYLPLERRFREVRKMVREDEIDW